MAACLQNAEQLLESAKAVLAPGRYHIAYHLAALAMEEIGKATLIFTESLEIDQVRAEEEAESLRGKWMEDHERELFWALWLPAFGIESDWRAIPRYMELAKGIHETRVSTLYFDPEFPKAQEELSQGTVERLISLTTTRLQMAKAKSIGTWMTKNVPTCSGFSQQLAIPR